MLNYNLLKQFSLINTVLLLLDFRVLRDLSLLLGFVMVVQGLVLLLGAVCVSFPRLLFGEVVDEHAQDVLDIFLTFTGILLVFLTKILGLFFGHL